jgi:hypothetical protein
VSAVHRQGTQGDQLGERAVDVLTVGTDHRREFGLRQADADAHPASDRLAVPVGELQKVACDDARRILVPECRRCLQQGAVRRAAFSYGRLSTCSCELTWPMADNAG